MSEPIPYNFELEKAYLQKVNDSLSLQKDQYLKRKEANLSRAKVQTQKLVYEYKRSKLETEEKINHALSNESFYVPAESKFFVVIRIRGMNRVPPKERKTLDLMRLRKPNMAVLLPNNESIRAQLQLVRNYVAYGYIGIDVLRKLVYMRGMTTKTKIDASSKLTKTIMNISNENIEDKFNGELCCVEDLIHNLYFGIKFSEANRFLNAFKLNCPRGGFKGKKAKDIADGGSCGNWHDKIGDLLMKMID